MPVEMVTEASTIGLKPGQWPKELNLDGVRCHRKEMQYKDGELIGYIYVASHDNTVEIMVLND